MPITLIGGGSRSGKSCYALARAKQCGSRIAFVATAQPSDEEMRIRIDTHRLDRGPEFITYEEPLALAEGIQSLDSSFDAIVVDCLTLWLNNVMLAGVTELAEQYTRLVAAASQKKCPVIFVTNEVGCGIVPENALARRFRDEAGRLNQTVAWAASEVYWMVFGIPLQVKGGPTK